MNGTSANNNEFVDLPPQQEINLREYWDILWRRRWLIGAFALALIFIVGVWTFTARPTYTAKGTLLIEKEANILTFEEIFQIESFRDDYYQTQYKLLQSRALAAETVNRLNLFENKEFVGNGRNGAKSGKDDPVLRQKLINEFLSRLQIKPLRLTRLVEVSFSSRSPKLAADGVNTLFDAFIDMNVNAKYEATEQATEFLTQQINGLRTEIAAKERELQSYGAEKNIIALSDTETTIVDKLGELNKALTEAQIDRLRKEANYNEIRNASADYIPEAVNNPLIQRLREDYVRMSREYSKKSETFRPEYPEMVRLKAELDSARELLANETNNLIKAAYSEFQGAQKREMSLQSVFDNQKKEALQLNSNAILYNGLKIELDNKKSLIETLLKRESETGVSARLRGLRTSNIRIVDRADEPLQPSSPKKRMNMVLALLFGLFGGVGLALLLDHLDDTIKGAQDIEKNAQLPTLGIVPTFSLDEGKSGYGYGRKKKIKEGRGVEDDRGAKEKSAEPPVKSIELITHLAPKSNFSESYRSIRTSLLLSGSAPDLRAIIVTSPLPSEGKTVTVSNLAVTLAQTGKRVLVIDADLRKPRMHRIFRMRNLTGLTNFLTTGVELKELVKATEIPNLYLITSGPVPPNPAELLGSDKMFKLLETLKGNFAYILIDTPPILAVTDALVLGPAIDGFVIIVWGDKTPRDALKQARDTLEMTKIKTLGVIINNLNVHKHGSYYKSYYYKYQHYYEEGQKS